MYFTISCSNCGGNLRVPEDAGGRRVRCPHCRHAVQIPMQEAEEPAAESMDDLTALSQAQSSEAPAARKPSKARSKSTKGKGKSAAPEAAQREPASRPAARASHAPRRKPQKSSDTDGTNVSLLMPALGAVVFTIVMYVMLLPLRGTKLGDMFFIGGLGSWVPPTLVFFLGWALFILFFKSRLLAMQKRVMVLELLPSSIAEDITPENVDTFAEHVRRQPADPNNTFLLRRVLRGLEHFKVRKSNTEVAEVLRSQSDIDANSVDASYTMLKVFIWAIPILGFIGTVIGISEAVSGFSGTLTTVGAEAGGEENMQDTLLSSLNIVVGGLGTAFDTTLVALVMSIFVMFPTSSMQKAEEDLINAVDSYCNENLLTRLDDGHAEMPHLNSQVLIERAIATAMAGHHGELRSWTDRIKEMGEKFNEQVAQEWQSIHQRQRDALSASVTEIQEAAKSTFTGQQTMVMEQQQLFDKAVNISERLTQIAENRSEEQVQSTEAWAEAQRKLAYQLDVARQETGAVKTEMEQKVQDQLNASVEALTKLNDVMASLGEKQVIVQQVYTQRVEEPVEAAATASQTGSDSWMQGGGGGSGGSKKSPAPAKQEKPKKGWLGWLGVAGG